MGLAVGVAAGVVASGVVAAGVVAAGVAAPVSVGSPVAAGVVVVLPPPPPSQAPRKAARLNIRANPKILVLITPLSPIVAIKFFAC